MHRIATGGGVVGAAARWLFHSASSISPGIVGSDVLTLFTNLAVQAKRAMQASTCRASCAESITSSAATSLVPPLPVMIA